MRAPDAGQHRLEWPRVVATTNGPVRGAHRHGIDVFHAVPYAATPTGRARFAVPTPPESWTRVRDASIPRPSMAPAPARDRIGDLDLTAISGPPWRPGDHQDYLAVDVWAPAAVPERRPVVVFVHGGGFIGGWGGAAAYDGTSLARHGLIVVTVNYRLGAAGWLHLPDAPDNRGLLDVLAALSWVRENIEEFGGDPGRVTVLGQSAGATIVAALLAMPAAKGLFQRAISQSGNALGAFTPAQAEKVTEALATAAGVEATADGFAAVGDRDLIRVVSELGGLDLTIGGVPDPMLGLSPFAPVLDPASIPTQPAESITSGMDLLAGVTTDEANLYLVPTGRDGDAEAMSRALFGLGTAALARANTALGGRTFRYEFAWRSGAFGGALGAAHTVELPFVFGTAHLPSLRGPRSLLGIADDLEQVTAAVQRAWVAFIRDGDPGWPPNDPAIRRLGVRLPVQRMAG
ncbi:carboxylesterase family protein [Nocardia xishanensis]|uniref:carboxylesterase family protein n=1 Tax=Nocardia xishanensis TaxID=238964 RepID=UPI0033DA9EF2